MITTLRRLWAGEVPLDEAFWTWAVGGGLLVNLTTSFLFLALIVADQTLAAAFVGYGLSVPYNVLVTVGVWRAGARYEGSRMRADVIRMVTLIGMAILSLT
ncbi:MAG TPA: hypothetical protein VFZ01_05645 [Geminicoccaceae bacterium]